LQFKQEKIEQLKMKNIAEIDFETLANQKTRTKTCKVTKVYSIQINSNTCNTDQ